MSGFPLSLVDAFTLRDCATHPHSTTLEHVGQIHFNMRQTTDEELSTMIMLLMRLKMGEPMLMNIVPGSNG